MNPMYTVAYGESRGFTKGLHALLEEGMMSPEAVLNELLCWLSEDEVARFVQNNWMFRGDENDCIIGYPEEESEEA